nr:hypothetical protein HUO10_003306 [Paraburkholderia busanensis]
MIEIDSRTRDNPESAMCQRAPAPQGDFLLYTDEFLRQIDAFWRSQGQAMNAGAGGENAPWPWPKSGVVQPTDAQWTPEELARAESQGREGLKINRIAPTPYVPPSVDPARDKHFDSEAHRSFMRGLG